MNPFNVFLFFEVKYAFINSITFHFMIFMLSSGSSCNWIPFLSVSFLLLLDSNLKFSLTSGSWKRKTSEKGYIKTRCQKLKDFYFHLLNIIWRKPFFLRKYIPFWPKTQLIRNRYHIDLEKGERNPANNKISEICYPLTRSLWVMH